MSTTPDSAVRAYIALHREAFLQDLAEWLRIPSVSADPERAGEVRRSAEWLAAKLSDTGFTTAEIWETDGLPAVFAEWPSDDPSAPTVLVYGHHDVQPAAREDGWHTDPFTPHTVDGKLYARGAADDKGQVFFHTLGVRAHLAATGRTAPAVNLKLLIEGEEESGSPNFPALIEKHADRLACDAVIVSDTGMWSRNTPTVCTGMRGLTDCQIDLYGPDQDIHSGSFGGAVPNPATEAARLAAALHDTDRRVAVPGFYDGVIELTERERELFAELPFDEEERLRTAHSHAPSARRAARPWSASGPAPPPRSTASAAATRAPAARPSCRPPHSSSCPSGWSRARARPPCSSPYATGSPPSSRPASATRSPSGAPPAPASPRSTTPRSGPSSAPWAWPSNRRSASPARAAPDPRPTCRTSSASRSSSWGSPCRPTAGTHRTKRSSSTC